PQKHYATQRRAQLMAAALAEDAADQRRLGDHVGDLPVLRLLAERRVFAGHLRRVEPGLGDVRVDAGDVVGDVLDELRALGAAEHGGLVYLALQVGLGV